MFNTKNLDIFSGNNVLIYPLKFQISVQAFQKCRTWFTKILGGAQVKFFMQVFTHVRTHTNAAKNKITRNRSKICGDLGQHNIENQFSFLKDHRRLDGSLFPSCRYPITLHRSISYTGKQLLSDSIQSFSRLIMVMNFEYRKRRNGGSEKKKDAHRWREKGMLFCGIVAKLRP